MQNEPVLAHRDNARHDGAYRGRRITWAEFYRLRPDLKPANENIKQKEEAV